MTAAAALHAAPLGCVPRAMTSADAGFVFNAWALGAREVPPNNRVPLSRWTPAQSGHMAACVRRGTTLVAWHPDTLEDHGRLGFVCFEHRAGLAVVHWAYVRGKQRGLGLGRYLLELALEGAATRPVVYTQEGKATRALGRRLELRFDPYPAGQA